MKTDLVVPPHGVEEWIAAYRKAGCTVHEGELWFKARCQQALAMGLTEVTEESAARLLVSDGRRVITVTDYSREQQLPWFYDHYHRKEFPGKTANQYSRPPLFSGRPYRVHRVALPELKCDIPLDVLNRLDKLRQLQFFNCFFAFATEHAALAVAALTHGHYLSWQSICFRANAKLRYFAVARWAGDGDRAWVPGTPVPKGDIYL